MYADHTAHMAEMNAITSDSISYSDTASPPLALAFEGSANRLPLLAYRRQAGQRLVGILAYFSAFVNNRLILRLGGVSGGFLLNFWKLAIRKNCLTGFWGFAILGVGKGVAGKRLA